MVEAKETSVPRGEVATSVKEQERVVMKKSSLG